VANKTIITIITIIKPTKKLKISLQISIIFIYCRIFFTSIMKFIMNKRNKQITNIIKKNNNNNLFDMFGSDACNATWYDAKLNKRKEVINHLKIFKDQS